MLKTAYPHVFEVETEGPASRRLAGRIRVHSAPGEETDRLTEVGHFLLDAQPAEEEEPPIQCFVRTEYRSSRRAIEAAIREGAISVGAPAGTITADVRLRFYWTTPEIEREATPPPVAAASVTTSPVAAVAGRSASSAENSAQRIVSYVPDTDEVVPEDRKAEWRARGVTALVKSIAVLAFIAGVALVAMMSPHFLGAGDAELGRPANAVPDLAIGGMLVVLALAFLVTDKAGLMLVVGALLWMYAGGHYFMNGKAGPIEIGGAVLGLMAALCTVLGRPSAETAKD
jgi:hypothetical protein